MTPVPPPSPVPDSDDAVSARHPRITVPVRKIALLLLNVPLLAIFIVMWATQPSGQLVQGAQSPPTATSGQSSTFAPEGGGSPVATTNATGGPGGHSTATRRPLHARQPRRQRQRLPRRRLPPPQSRPRRRLSRPSRHTRGDRSGRADDSWYMTATCATSVPE
jgi:hypothetical protein